MPNQDMKDLQSKEQIELWLARRYHIQAAAKQAMDDMATDSIEVMSLTSLFPFL